MGLWDSSGGAQARQWLIASWLWSAGRVWAAFEVLEERSAQPNLSWRVVYRQVKKKRVPSFDLLISLAHLQPSLGFGSSLQTKPGR
jgi:hypothetical protein